MVTLVRSPIIFMVHDLMKWNTWFYVAVGARVSYTGLYDKVGWYVLVWVCGFGGFRACKECMSQGMDVTWRLARRLWSPDWALTRGLYTRSSRDCRKSLAGIALIAGRGVWAMWTQMRDRWITYLSAFQLRAVRNTRGRHLWPRMQYGLIALFFY